MNTKLELKRSVMLAHGLKLPDQELDKMQLYEKGDGSGFVLRFTGLVSTKEFKGQYGSCKAL